MFLCDSLSANVILFMSSCLSACSPEEHRIKVGRMKTVEVSLMASEL